MEVKALRLSFLLGGILALGVFGKAVSYCGKVEREISTKIISRDEFVRDKFTEKDGNLDSYDQLLNLEKMRSGFKKEYYADSELRRLRRKRYNYNSVSCCLELAAGASGVAALLGGVGIGTAAYKKRRMNR